MRLLKSVAVLILLWLSTLPAHAESIAETGNTKIQSFNKAKKILMTEVYADHRVTFYCGCPFDEKKRLLETDAYTPKRPGARANRIEWEHVVAAQHFGQHFAAWREGDPECRDRKGKTFKGRKCAGKTSRQFRYMQADMYNLYPAVGEINGYRSNYRFGVITGEDREFGPCDIEIEKRIAEPPARIRGDIARTYMYFEAAYPRFRVISKANRKLFAAWDKLDPVDEWECERCRRIEALQGNENPVVKAACRAAGLWPGE